VLRAVPGLNLGLTGYWDYLHDPINNVVTASNPMTGADAARTRENLGRARIRGYQVDGQYDFDWIIGDDWSQYHPKLSLNANYLHSEATLTSSPPDPTLVGRRLALVPWDTLSVGLRYSDTMLGNSGFRNNTKVNNGKTPTIMTLQPSYWLTNLSWTRFAASCSQCTLDGGRHRFPEGPEPHEPPIRDRSRRQYSEDRHSITIMGGLTVPLNF